MLLLHTSDLHGQAGHFAALAKAVETIRPDLLILGGNMFPDDAANVPEEMGKRQPVYVLETFRQWLNGVFKSNPQLTVATVFGNHDWLSSSQAMEELSKQNPRVRVLTHEKPFELSGLAFLGYSRTPPTARYSKDFERLDQPGDRMPLVGGARWNAARRLALAAPAKVVYTQFPTMADEIEKISTPAGPWVFVATAPPYGTKLDQNFHREHVGSKAVRTAIEKRHPLLSLHGHVVGSPDVTGECQEMVGQTTAVNVGQHAEGLCYAVVEVDVAGRRIVRVEARRPQ